MSEPGSRTSLFSDAAPALSARASADNVLATVDENTRASTGEEGIQKRESLSAAPHAADCECSTTACAMLFIFLRLRSLRRRARRDEHN